MAVSLIMAGLSLLPKIPKMWDAVAGLFGKKVPSGVKEAGKLASDIMGDFKKDQISPEVQVKLKELMMEHEEEMAKLALEEKKLEFEGTKLEYGDVAGVRELEMASYKVDDEYVRRTRPMILRKLFYGCLTFAFVAPAAVVTMSLCSVAAATVASATGMVEWIGAWLFGTFSTAFLGYAAARSVDKKNPKFKEGTGLVNKSVKKIMEFM